MTDTSFIEKRGPGRPPKNTQALGDETSAPPAPEGVEVTYCPQEGDPIKTTWRGIVFQANVGVLVADADHVNAARGNRSFKVDGETKQIRKDIPTTDMEYRAYVVAWLAEVETVEGLVKRWAGDKALRVKCEVGELDLNWLGTMIEPKLSKMAKEEGKSAVDVSLVWVKYGINSIPWRSH